MSTKIRRVDFSPDEFIAGTVGLTPEELGVHWLVCALIYSSGKAIHRDDFRLRSLKASPRTVRAIVVSLVAKGKIQIDQDGMMMVKRCRNEIERASKRIQIAAENGSKGGRPKTEVSQNQEHTKPEALSAEKLTINHQPPTIQPSTSQRSVAEELGRTIFQILGRNVDPGTHFGKVNSWLIAGYKPDEIKAVAAQMGDRMMKTDIRDPLSYIGKAMPDEIAKLRAAGATSAHTGGTVADTAVTEQWLARCRGLKRGGIWLDAWGARPGEPRCEVPLHILEELEMPSVSR